MSTTINATVTEQTIQLDVRTTGDTTSYVSYVVDQDATVAQQEQARDNMLAAPDFSRRISVIGTFHTDDTLLYPIVFRDMSYLGCVGAVRTWSDHDGIPPVGTVKYYLTIEDGVGSTLGTRYQAMPGGPVFENQWFSSSYPVEPADLTTGMLAPVGTVVGDPVITSQELVSNDSVRSSILDDPSAVRAAMNAEELQTPASGAEMQAGTETAIRSMTPERVKQAIAAQAVLTTAQALTDVGKLIARHNIGVYPTISTIAFLGDSITNATSGFSTGAGAAVHYTRRSFSGFAAALSGHAFAAKTNAYALAGASVPDLDFGWDGVLASAYDTSTVNALSSGGNQYAGIELTPLGAAIETGPDAYVLFIGTNDIAATTAAATLTRIAALAAAIPSDKQLFVAELLPRTATAADPTATYQTKINEVNAGLAAAVAPYNAVIIQWHDALATGGVANPAYFNDEDAGAGTIYLHPNAAGHSVMGGILYDTISPYLGGAYRVPVKGSAKWLTTNPYMDVDVSTANGVADGFTNSSTGSPTSTIVSSGGYTWQQQVFPGAGAVFIYAPTISAGLFADLITNATPVRVCCEFEVDEPSVITAIALTCPFRDAGAVVLKQANQGSDAASEGFIRSARYLYMSPPTILPANTVSGQANILIRLAGAATVRLRRFGVFKDI